MTPAPHALPVGKKAPERRGLDRLDLLTKTRQCLAPERAQHLLIAELGARAVTQERSLDHALCAHQRLERERDRRVAEAEPSRNVGRGEGAVRACVAGDEIAQRIAYLFE